MGGGGGGGVSGMEGIRRRVGEFVIAESQRRFSEKFSQKSTTTLI